MKILVRLSLTLPWSFFIKITIKILQSNIKLLTINLMFSNPISIIQAPNFNGNYLHRKDYSILRNSAQTQVHYCFLTLTIRCSILYDRERSRDDDDWWLYVLPKARMLWQFQPQLRNFVLLSISIIRKIFITLRPNLGIELETSCSSVAYPNR